MFKDKDRVGPLKDSAGNLIEDNNRMCDTLNNFFVSVFTQENTDTVPEAYFHFIPGQKHKPVSHAPLAVSRGARS